MASGSKVVGRWLGPWGQRLHEWGQHLHKRVPRAPSPFPPLRTQKILSLNKEEDPDQTLDYADAWSWTFSLRNERTECLLFKPLCLWCLVAAAQANEDNNLHLLWSQRIQHLLCDKWLWSACLCVCSSCCELWQGRVCVAFIPQTSLPGTIIPGTWKYWVVEWVNTEIRQKRKLEQRMNDGL